MFQPRVKLEFVKRFCQPKDGWRVCVDIDASEEGRTGGERVTEESIERQRQMRADAEKVRKEFEDLGVRVGGRKAWCKKEKLPYIEGDIDVVAYQRDNRCVIAEVEGASSGQPEQKLYKAVGQMVRTVGCLPSDWHFHCSIVVHGGRSRLTWSRCMPLRNSTLLGLPCGRLSLAIAGCSALRHSRERSCGRPRLATRRRHCFTCMPRLRLGAR